MKRRSLFIRKVGTRDPRSKCIIFCEGKRTEPEYFDAFKLEYPRSIFSIECVKGAGVPKTLLEKALEFKKDAKRRGGKGRSFAENDSIWIAFDCDEHPEVRETIQRARSHDIGVAFSNPCFELWLVLHVEDFDRPVHRHELQKHCERRCPGYDRNLGKSAKFSVLLKELEAAERRAEGQVIRRNNEGSPLDCPSTTVFELTRVLRGIDPTPIPR